MIKQKVRPAITFSLSQQTFISSFSYRVAESSDYCLHAALSSVSQLQHHIVLHHWLSLSAVT